MKDSPFAGLTVTIPPPTEPKHKNRCACCNKKLVLSDFACGKCQIRHCSTHRLPELHSCTHDFRATGATQLKEQLVRVIADKIEHI